ncbi:hypothetical protein OHB33_29150 [Streptomyces sp. NBC_01558]|uniref:hypothetical protein n=1 Tax=Streptomyces sp. NBC_01558 TaxID=2975878 RepID=UPI002DDAC578|nr:hypothetical protein [Streptomyces sp. NBC_01558]WSD80046.1 hypothetical protein OHB33_29150 [Streptomyces sp. NBC_01558]
MNLGWIAAVLQPHDVAIHPNFRDESYSQEPVGQLASLVIGGDWRRPLHDGIIADEAVTYTERSFNTETIAEGAEGLIQQAFSRRRSDVARSTALVLLACCALAEMEEYEKCDSILTEMIARTGRSSHSRLARAALLQQRALRRRDAGRQYVEDVFEGARLLEGLDGSDFPRFSLGPGKTGSSAETIERIIYSLKRAAWSLTPHDLDDELPMPSFPSRMERLKRPLSDRLLRIAADRASHYSENTRRTFTRHFGRGTTVTVGQSPVDLFHETLAVELLGHAEVYKARKDLALLRLVQHAEGAESENLQDTLRLLRHAGATKELELALEFFRSAGPLSALSFDARQILLRRSSPTQLRVPELWVLRAAAEVMALPEAENAMQVVLESIAAGGPPDVAGSWQHAALRLGAAWQTAAVLANTCQKGDEVASLLLAEIRAENPYNELHDQSFAKALRSLPWDKMEAPLKAEWAAWLSSDQSERLPDTLEVVSIGTGHATFKGESLSGLSEIAMKLNTSFSDGATRLRADEVADAVAYVTEALDEIRGSAEHGSFAVGSRSASDICALLIVEYEEAHALWGPLSQFLTANRISRFDRSPAFERLARETPLMPPDVRMTLQGQGSDLLEGERHFSPWEETIVPYPSALRFLIAYDLIDEARIIAAVAELSGSRDLEAKREAARTLAASAARRTPSLLPFALQMSYETDVSIRANAARFLVPLSGNDGGLERIAAERLADLLNEDGLLIPLYVLRELTGMPHLPTNIARVVGRLAREHPSRQVRRAACEWQR